MILRNVTVTSDREGIEDAVYRFVEGIDKRDADLIASAFTEDIIFDLVLQS
jgi:ketosteroid isomerase-like protein